DDLFLVREGNSWDVKIADIRRYFDDVQERILNARKEVLKQISLQRIGQNWLAYVEQMLVNRANPSPGRVPATKHLSNSSIIVSSRRSADATASELGGTVFGRKHQIPSPSSPMEDFLKRYEMIWETLHSEKRQWIVLLPDGLALAYGFAEELTQAKSAHPGL